MDLALSYVSPTKGSGTLDYLVDGASGFKTTMVNTAIDEVFRLSQNGETNSDFEFDGIAGIDDSATLTSDLGIVITEIVGTLFGDITLDGKVNQADLNIMGLHWQMAIFVDFWGVGDMNGDGIVDAQDLNLLGGNWQQSNGN